jgi:TetR/AcrR family fatty acid metabolism transcriptional regulator
MSSSNTNDDRKSQIMNAAETVFTEKGFDKTRMDDIAKETGLGKGTLYLYFKSKDELITATIGRIFQNVFKHLNLPESDDLSAAETLMKFTEDAIHDYQKMLRVMPIAYEFLALSFRNTVARKAMQAYFDNYMQHITPIIQRGIDSGEFRQVDVQDVAIAAGAIFEGTILLWTYDRHKVDITRHIRSGIHLLLDGIRAPT